MLGLSARPLSEPGTQPMPTQTNDHLQTLREMRSRAVLGGGRKRIEQQHARGKFTARERLALLLDEGTFQEFGALATHQVNEFGLERQRFPGDGIVTGFGKVSGRRVAVFAQDFTVLGGSFSEVQAQKISRIQDLAIESGIPIIGLNDSGGARIQEGVRSLAAYGEVFVRNVMASGVIPQISLILGPCAGGAVYSPALTDFVVMAGDSTMFLTGPDVIKAVTGEQVSAQTLGGAEVHTGRSGVAHLAAPTELAGVALVKRLLSYLPQNNAEDPPQIRPEDPPGRMDDALNTLIPNDENQPYDMRDAITAIFDADSFLEIQPAFAANAVVGFVRLDGYPVGVVANQPACMSGVLNIDASDKIARFIRTCDAYNLPIVTFVDCPGFLPGVDQEYAGVIRHGAKIIYAYCEATVPKISVVTRKAMGGAYVAMGSKQMRTDLAFAWPTAQIAVMGAEPAVRVLYREEVAGASDPAARTRELVADYREKFFNPYRAADVGQIDEVIEPRETRPRLVRALEVLRTKVQQNPPKKHGLSPT
jgi:acetyl-CoA carboxylase carboxyltransferase component